MKLKTNQQHPITPPPELVEQWAHMLEQHTDFEVFAAATRWGYQQGADAELNECCKWLPKLPPWSADDLRAARRPNPPSLKEQALQALGHLDKGAESQMDTTEAVDTIRRALEALPE